MYLIKQAREAVDGVVSEEVIYSVAGGTAAIGSIGVG